MVTTETIAVRDLIDELATTYDIAVAAAREAVESYAEQLVDLDGHDTVWSDPETLTGAGATGVREAMAAQYGPGHHSTHEQYLAEAVDAYDAAVNSVDIARSHRDSAIRAALASGMTYRDVQAATGLSRGMVDAIRRGLSRLS